jgi:hypothetical protein
VSLSISFCYRNAEEGARHDVPPAKPDPGRKFSTVALPNFAAFPTSESTDIPGPTVVPDRTFAPNAALLAKPSLPVLLLLVAVLLGAAY